MSYLGISPVDGIQLPLQIDKGGTGATTQSGARSGIGITNVGSSIVTSATTSTAQTALGGGAASKAVFSADTIENARSNLGLGTSATLNVGTSANNVVQLNGSGALPAVSGANLTGIGGGFSNIVAFTTVGTSNWTVPAGITKCKILLLSGGGGGSGFFYNTCGTSSIGGGGGSGKTVTAYLTVVPGSSVSVTVGGGGGGSSATTTTTVSAGNSGGTSSFGALVSCTGGGGGGSHTVSPGAGGSPGIASGSVTYVETPYYASSGSGTLGGVTDFRQFGNGGHGGGSIGAAGGTGSSGFILVEY